MGNTETNIGANTTSIPADTEMVAPVEPGATLPVPAVSAEGGPSDKQIDKSLAAVNKADQAVIDAQKALDDSRKSKEQRDLEDAQLKASEARSKHIDLVGSTGGSTAPMTVAQAKVVAVVDPGTSAGDWRAQKFGNDPSNPQMAPGIKPDENHVKLSRKTPDLPGDGMAYTSVPKEMAGDYERAGWNRA